MAIVRLQLLNKKTGYLCVPREIMLFQRLQPSKEKPEEFSVEAEGDDKIVYTRLKKEAAPLSPKQGA